MIFAGFDQLTPQQRKLITALSLQDVSVTILSAEPESADAETIRSVKLADRSAELTMAAGWARAHLEANPSANLGVVIAGLSEIKDRAEQTFSAILHPEQYFAVRDLPQRAFDISLGRSLAEYPIVRSALIFLRLLSASVPLADFSAWLRSPYFGAVGEQGGQRAQLDWLLSQVLAPSVTLESVLAAMAKAGAKWYHGSRSRQTIASCAAGCHRQAQALPPNRWISEIFALLAAARWPAEVDGLVLTTEEYQARDAWEDLLAEIGSLDLVRPRMDVQRSGRVHRRSGLRQDF